MGWGDACGAVPGGEARGPLTSHNAVHRVWRENISSPGSGKEPHDPASRPTRCPARHAVRAGSRRRTPPGRIPDGAGPRGDPARPGVPQRRGDAPPARRRRGGGPGRGRDAHRAGRDRTQHRGGDRGGGPGRGAGSAREARARVRRTAHRRREGPPRGAARRPAFPLGLVRRRLADRGDGLHRDGARPRLPRAHRPLAAPDRGQRAQPGPAHQAARGRRRGQPAPRRLGLHAAEGDRGRHPRRRRPRPDRGDAGAARGPGGERALEAEDGARGHDHAG